MWYDDYAPHNGASWLIIWRAAELHQVHSSNFEAVDVSYAPWPVD